MNVSNQTEVRATDQKVYELLGDCRRLGNYLPEQVQDWKAEENACEFSIPGVAKANAHIVEKQQFEKIYYQIDNDKNVPLHLRFDIAGQGDACTLSVTVEIDLPIFLAPMVKGPVQKVVDLALEKIKTAAEQ